jgi:hypothetical protein
LKKIEQNVASDVSVRRIHGIGRKKRLTPFDHAQGKQGSGATAYFSIVGAGYPYPAPTTVEGEGTLDQHDKAYFNRTNFLVSERSLTLS